MAKILRFLLLCILGIMPGVVYAASPKQPQIEAVFVYKVTKYIKWPNAENLQLCVFGDRSNNEVADFTRAFSQYADKKNNSQHRIKVRTDISLYNMDRCNAVYIAESESRNLKDILAKLKNKPVATISNIPSFSERGGMFELGRQGGGKIQLILNYVNAEDSRIRVSADLLEVIKVVR